MYYMRLRNVEYYQGYHSYFLGCPLGQIVEGTIF